MPSRTSTSLPRWSLACLAAAALSLPAPARAQSSTALAEQLFLDGQKLMDAGQVPEACAKFAASQRLDPALGTLMHLAVCHEKEGKLATAWSEFLDAAAQARRASQTEREKFAKDHATALDGRLQKLIIELPHPPPGTVIKLDGIVLPTGVLGTELPLDPGDHSLEVTAAGKTAWRQAKLSLGPGPAVTRVQVNLGDDMGGGTAPPAVVPAATATAAAPAAAEAPAPAADPTKRLVGYLVGAAGLVSIGLGVAEEVTSIGRNNDESKYPAGSPERAQVASQSSEAQTYAIVFGAAGLAAVGAGLYLVFSSGGAPATAPAATARASFAPWVGPSVGGGAIRVAW